MSPGAAANVVTAGVLLHIAIVMVFLNFLPMGKHFHIITGLPTVYFQRLTPQGQLSKLDLETGEKFGVAKLTDLSWKEILDTYSCTECGRCQTYCPTYDTGKPLTHKEVNRAIRHHAQQVAASMPLPLGAIASRLNRVKPIANGHSGAPTDPAHHDEHGHGHGADGHGGAGLGLALAVQDRARPLAWFAGVLALCVLLAFGREIVRPAPRDGLVESLTGTLAGEVVAILAAGWLLVPRTALGTAGVLVAAAAVGAARLATALPWPGAVTGWVGVAAGTAAAAGLGIPAK
jgi:ferredoxin